MSRIYGRAFITANARWRCPSLFHEDPIQVNSKLRMRIVDDMSLGVRSWEEVLVPS